MGLYRYGFNGKENDNEVKGNGNQQDYGMRIYDPRVGRFLSVDPLFVKYAAFSPYLYALNNPIINLDKEGQEGVYFQPPKKHTVIVIATPEEIRGELGKTNSPGSVKYHGQWNVILATDFIGAEKQLKAYYKDGKAETILIHTHGSGLIQSRIQYKPGRNFTGAFLKQYNKDPESEKGRELAPDAYANADALKSIFGMVRENGNVIFSSCHAGAESEGDEMGRQLVQMSDGTLNVFLNTDYSTYYTYKGFGYGVGDSIESNR